ncbi:MAG TPA: YcxB family protein [Candidatus Dormibacteraeota bacterium]|nr:YcxB family protein [Candidatus Dormibacteraeota bacterium]
MSIEAQGQFALADVWRSNLLLSRDFLILSSILGAVLIAYATMGFVLNPAGRINHVVVFFVGLLFPGYVWFCALRRSRRALAGTPALQGAVKYEFDESGMRFDALHSRGEINWAAVVEWKEGKHVFLLYRSPGMAEIIPKRFFKNLSDVDSVRRLLASHVPE